MLLQTNRTVSYLIALLELLTVLLEYNYQSFFHFEKQEFIVLHKYSAYYASSMLSGTYCVHNYSTVIGRSPLKYIELINEKNSQLLHLNAAYNLLKHCQCVSGFQCSSATCRILTN